MSDSELLSIEKELEESPSLNAFILKYHRTNHPEIRYMITKATWQQAKIEGNDVVKVRLLKEFILENRTHQDIRIKKLVALSIEQLLELPANQLSDAAINDLCNEIIELCQSFNEKDIEIERILLVAYWRKAKQLEGKDRFKANFFYNRMILITQSSNAFDEYRWKAQISKVILTLEHSERIPEQIIDILSGMDDREISQEIGTLLLQLVHDFLISLKGLHKNLDLTKKTYAIEKIIEIKSFILLLNQFKDMELVNDILHYLTFIFWLDNNQAKSEILVRQYLQNGNKTVAQIIDNNYKFKILDHLDIESFNVFITEQHAQFSQRQKYRKMFKVNNNRDIHLD